MTKEISEILNRFFDGQCTSEEEFILDEWYHSYDAEDDPEEILDPRKREVLEAMVFNRINAKILGIEQPPLSATKKKGTAPIKKLAFIISGIAAILLIFLGIGLFRNPAAKYQQADEQLVFSNPTKTLIKITLPDSSTVWLSPKGKITAPKHFRKANREVLLDGLAFFDVKKNPAKPFLIRTATILTKVWGTSFTVNAYSHAATATVSVLTGKVSVSIPAEGNTHTGAKAKGTEIMLLPNQNATYLVASRKLLKQTEKSADLKIWRKVNLSFSNVKMSQVIRELNKKFGVKIIAADTKINDYLFIADLNGQDLPAILEILKTSLDLSYEIAQNSIYLKSNN